jgi:signal transduction histidine kinase
VDRMREWHRLGKLAELKGQTSELSWAQNLEATITPTRDVSGATPKSNDFISHRKDSNENKVKEKPPRSTQAHNNHAPSIEPAFTQHEQMERMKDQLISAVTNELQTPLTFINDYVNQALVTIVSESTLTRTLELVRIQSSLEGAKRNCDRVLYLIDDLLDLQRLRSGKLQLKLKPVDFTEVIRQCVEAIQPLIHLKGQNLSLELNEPTIPIEADSIRLSQVLTNLLTNASKFTPEKGSIKITVKEDVETVKAIVSDSGIGIRKEDLERVFEPFATIEKPTQIEGAALGLSVAKGLVEAHGGKIWAESEGLGKGAAFIFTLPRQEMKSCSVSSDSRQTTPTLQTKRK